MPRPVPFPASFAARAGHSKAAWLPCAYPGSIGLRPFRLETSLSCGRPWKIAATAAVLALPCAAQAQGTLKAVMHSDLKIVDPIWTTAYITRNHGYMIYDTLFAMDEKGEIKPQMVDKYDVSADKLTYTFTLRDGLAWHDGAPGHGGGLRRLDQALGREGHAGPEGHVVRRHDDGRRRQDLHDQAEGADRPPDLRARQAVLERAVHDAQARRRDRSEHADHRLHRLRPVRVQARRMEAGRQGGLLKFDNYKPRTEPASGLAGGKVAKVDRVEWLAIPDQQQAVNALLAGEIDYIEAPPHDLLPLLKADKNVKLVDCNPLGNQYIFRPNHLHPPFDNPKVRQALWYAFNQKDFLRGGHRRPDLLQGLQGDVRLRHGARHRRGHGGLLESNFQKARELLKEAGYDGTPVVLMHSTDLQVLTNLAPVAKSLMEQAGFKVDMQSMDWQTWSRAAPRRTRRTRAAGTPS